MIGHLRHRASLEEPVLVDDEGGGQELSWQLVQEIWVRVETGSGREIVRGAHLAPKIEYRVTARYQTGIEAGQRLAIDGRYLSIETAADPDGTRKTLRLECSLIDEDTL